jgi:hypothetical protein
MVLDVRLIPLLGCAHTAISKVSRLGRLAIGLDGATLVERNLAVVAGAAGGGAVCYLGAREFAFYVCCVDAGFGGCGGGRWVSDMSRRGEGAFGT